MFHTPRAIFLLTAALLAYVQVNADWRVSKRPPAKHAKTPNVDAAPPAEMRLPSVRSISFVEDLVGRAACVDGTLMRASDGLCATLRAGPTQGPGPRAGEVAPAADQPVARADSNSQAAHLQLLEKARRGFIDVYFVGDSITRRWGTSDAQYKAFLANWRENFFGWNAANFGWGGDTIQNILWRLSNGELDHVNPKIIVVLAGTNNVGNKSPRGGEDPRVADITRGIKALLDVCRRKAPRATIVLMGITPRNDNMAVMSVINEVNRRIAKFADGKKIRFLNINDKLAGRDGKLLEGMATPDGLHLDVKGYQAWADALKPIFNEVLGPPAKEDQAPPPTGDPSIKNRPASAEAIFDDFVREPHAELSGTSAINSGPRPRGLLTSGLTG